MGLNELVIVISMLCGTDNNTCQEYYVNCSISQSNNPTMENVEKCQKEYNSNIKEFEKNYEE